MRNIKFRAWDTTNKQFIESGIFLDQDGWIMDTKIDDGREDVVVQIFTGVTDKNSKEVYEGDICRSQAFRDVVEYADGRYYFARDIERLPIVGHSSFEVIGNVYENPELL